MYRFEEIKINIEYSDNKRLRHRSEWKQEYVPALILAEIEQFEFVAQN